MFEQVSSTASVSVILILVLYAVVLCKSGLDGKVLRRSALVILALSVALFMYGLGEEDHDQGVVACFLRALFNSVKLFLYDIDFTEFEEAQKKPLFIEAMMLVSYAAMLTSLSAIILLFGKRAKTFLILALRRRPFKHVFFGLDRRSQMIARGLEGADVTFIELPGETESNKISVAKMVKSLSDVNGDNWQIRNHATVLLAKNSITQMTSGESAFDQLGLGRFSRLVNSETNFYLLSDDFDKNLKDTLRIVSDDTLQDNTVHACVNRGLLTGAYQALLSRTAAHFIYPSSLSVVELMKNPDVHPCSLMKPVKGADGKALGCASGAFNAVIVGFGETGQALTKFLYEFSAAVGPDGKQLPVSIAINDENINALKEPFLFSSPALQKDASLTFTDYSLKTDAFWDWSQECIDSLNILALCTEEDGTNLYLACAAFNYLVKKEGGFPDNVRIIVLKKESPDYEKSLICRLNEKAGREVIIAFGEDEKIFTPELIVSSSRSGINRSAMSAARRMEESYEAISGSSKKGPEQLNSVEEKNRSRRETHQYISRANHIPSKLHLLDGDTEPSPEAIENLARMEHLRYVRYMMAHGYVSGPSDDDILRINHQICSWDELSDPERKYHRDMVRASLSVL